MKPNNGYGRYGQICIFGEVLFDHFPDKSKVLGGAPFNVAWNLQAFGQAPCFISRVGEDHEGHLIQEAMERRGLSTGTLQYDPEHRTGQVSIEFIENEPEYSIIEPCAYDFIAPTSETKDILRHCALLYHGTLALRDPVSAASFAALQRQHSGKVFLDVNLRTPWWQKKQVLSLIEQADWIKLNAAEAALLFALKQEQDVEQELITLISKYNLQGIILTRGAQGAVAATAERKKYTVHPDTTIPVVDTVGAGDAFASIMILGLHKQWPIETTLQRAQKFASAVVGQRGATVSDRCFYDNFICQWKADVITD